MDTDGRFPAWRSRPWSEQGDPGPQRGGGEGPGGGGGGRASPARCPARPPSARNKLTGSGKDFPGREGSLSLPSPVRSRRRAPAAAAAAAAADRARLRARRSAPLRTLFRSAPRPAGPGSALAGPIDSLQPAAAVIKSHLHPGLLTQSWSANNYLLAHFRT